MKQAGHRLITQQVVDHLFAGHEAGQRLLGLGSHDFYQALNRDQARADRWYGDTWHPSWLSPGVKRFHSMADPAKTALRNIDDIKTFVVAELFVARAVHDRGDVKTEFVALGAAVHAVEDSYSNAHMFRDPQRPDDPHSPIIGINNFSPGGAMHGQTHAGEFDELVEAEGHLERGTDQAAVTAVTELLMLYMQQLDSTNAQAYSAFSTAVSEIYTPAPEISVHANNDDPSFHADRLAHLANDICRDYAAEHAAAQSETLNGSGPTHGLAEPSHPVATTNDGMAAPHELTSAPQDSPNPPHESVQHGPASWPDAVQTAVPSGAQPDGAASSLGTHFVHPTGGVEDSVTHASHGKTFEIQGRGPAEHAADARFSGWAHENGKDILCPVGTPVFTVDGGVIGRQFGNTKSHDGQLQGARLHLESAGNEYYYAHLSGLAPGLHPGSVVHKGDLLGYSGSGGGVAHLHFAAKEPNSTMAVLKHASTVEAHDGHHATRLTSLEAGGGSNARGHDVGQLGHGPSYVDGSPNHLHPSASAGTVDRSESAVARGPQQDGGMSLPDGSIGHGEVSDGGDGHRDGGMSMPDGSTIYGDGSSVGGAHHDGGMGLPEGSIDHGDTSRAGETQPEGGMSLPNGSIGHSDSLAAGNTHHDGGMNLPDNSIGHGEVSGGGGAQRDGGMSMPDGSTAYGDGLGVGGAHREGGMSLPDGSIDHSDASGAGIAQPEGGMSLPQGTIGHNVSLGTDGGAHPEVSSASVPDASAAPGHTTDDAGFGAG